MMKTKSKKEATKVSKTVGSKKHRDIVVAPINLPLVIEKARPKFSFTRLMGWTTIIVGLGLVFGGIVYGTVSVYKKIQPRPIWTTTRLQRAIPQPQTPVILEPEPIPENVVALVGDEQITIEQVQDFVNEIPQLKEVPFEQIYPKMLDLVINDKVVELGAADMGIPEHPQIQKMVRLATNQIITQAYLAQLLDKAITQQDLREIYAEQVQAFQPQDEIRARHILLATEEQAKNTLIQLQAGADFAALANQKSLDKNAPDGELGYFTKDMMIPEFAEAVFKMKKGELSAPVQTAFGWHVIQVLDRRKTQPPSFESQQEHLQQVAMERKLPQILQKERERRSVRILRPKIQTSTDE